MATQNAHLKGDCSPSRALGAEKEAHTRFSMSHISRELPGCNSSKASEDRGRMLLCSTAGSARGGQVFVFAASQVANPV